MVEGDPSWLLGVKSLPGHMWFCSSASPSGFFCYEDEAYKAARKPHTKKNPTSLKATIAAPDAGLSSLFHLFFFFSRCSFDQDGRICLAL